MTKAEITELVKGYLSGGSTTQDMMHKVDARRLQLYIAAAYQDILYEVFRISTEGLSLYARTYDGIAVAQDGTTDVYTATLPKPIIQFPGVAQGVRRISIEDETTLDFVPLDASEFENFSMLDAGNTTICDSIGYCLRDNLLVEFFNFPNSRSGDLLRMDLIIPFNEFDSTDEVFLPSGKASVLIQGVVSLLTGRPTVDLTNDNATKAEAK